MRLSLSVLQPESPQLGGIAFCCQHWSGSPELVDDTTIGTMRPRHLARYTWLQTEYAVSADNNSVTGCSAELCRLSGFRSHVSSLIRRLGAVSCSSKLAADPRWHPVRDGRQNETQPPAFRVPLFIVFLLFCRGVVDVKVVRLYNSTQRNSRKTCKYAKHGQIKKTAYAVWGHTNNKLKAKARLSADLWMS